MRRLPWLVLLTAAVLTVAGCGDDDVSTGDTRGDDGPSPGSGDPAAAGDEVVVEISQVGGLAGPSPAADVPVLVVLADGRLVQTGPTTLEYPGALLPNLQERPISEDGIEHLLDLADEHGLLAERSYETVEGVMDAPDTVVRITAGDRVYEHVAYGLGLGADGEETDSDRADLQAFVAAATEFAVSRDPALGDEQPYEADAYLIRAVPDTGEPAPDGIVGATVEWPPAAGVRLADAGECAEVPATAVAALLDEATTLTRFVDGGETYALTAMPRLPGRTCG